MGVRRGMDPLPGIGASAVAGVEPGIDFADFETDAESCRQPRRSVEEAAAAVGDRSRPVPG